MEEAYIEIASIFEKLSQCYTSLAKELSQMEKSQNNLSQTSQTKDITIENLREVLASKSKIGKTFEVKELLSKFGANKLSQVKEEDFPALMLESQKL